MIVKNQQEALDVCRDIVPGEKIDSILLCPGFTNADVATIAEAAGKNVSVCVARGDGPGSRITMEAFKREGWFDRK